MYEKYIIANQGFKNIIQNTQVTGFQINIKIPTWRGASLSSINSIKLEVDGQEYLPENMSFMYGRQVFTYDELQKADDVFWFVGDPLTLLINKPGGLKPGIYNVVLRIALGADRSQPVPDYAMTTASKKMTIVQ